MVTKERVIQDWVKLMVDKEFGKDSLYIKYHAGAYASRGVSDLILCVRGLYIAIEVKTETGKITTLQKRFIENVKQAGGLGYVIYGKDEKLMQRIFDDVRNAA